MVNIKITDNNICTVLPFKRKHEAQAITTNQHVQGSSRMLLDGI